MQKKWQVPFMIASVSRLAYGFSCMVIPEKVGGLLAPTVGDPDARMNLRGFGGAQSGIALYTLARATTPERAQEVLRLNAMVDAFDACVSVLEIRGRGGVDAVAAGGVAVNVLGLVCWTSAALALRD